MKQQTAGALLQAISNVAEAEGDGFAGFYFNQPTSLDDPIETTGKTHQTTMTAVGFGLTMPECNAIVRHMCLQIGCESVIATAMAVKTEAELNAEVRDGASGIILPGHKPPTPN